MSKPGSAGNVLAALASAFVPGLGQLLQGRLGAAILHFLFAIFLGIVLFIFTLGLLAWAYWIPACLDAALYKSRDDDYD